MASVIDANLPIVLATDDPRADAVERQLQSWLDAGEDLHAPLLLRYEAANALTRLIVAGKLAIDELPEAWRLIEAFPVRLHSINDGAAVIRIALRLGRQNAYDAAYLALAQQLGAELWTLDGPLARNAIGLGFRVRLIE